MKQIKQFMLRCRARGLKYTLWALGFAGFGVMMSCHKMPDPIAMYGAPYPDNSINFHGKASSQDSLKPIPNLKVKLYVDGFDTVYGSTNAQGDYSLYQYAYENQNVKLIFSDVDDTLNGRFVTNTTATTVSFRDVNNSEHQANVTLERKP